MTNATFTPLSPLFSWLEGCMQVTRAALGPWTGNDVPIGFRKGILNLSHTKPRIKLLDDILNGIHKGNRREVWFGNLMRPYLTLNAAGITRDFNPRHVGKEIIAPFEEPIAHGVHAFSEGIMAFWLYLRISGIAMRIVNVITEFHQPVFLRGRRNRYDIHQVEDDPTQYVVEAYAKKNTLKDKKPVLIMRISVIPGAMSHDELKYNLYTGGWLVSSLLARVWHLCLFFQLSLRFGEQILHADASFAKVKGTGSYQDKKNRLHVTAEFTAGTASGTVDILPHIA